MKAWRVVPNDIAGASGTFPPLVADDVPEPELAGDQVLVRVQASVFGEPERTHIHACIPGGAAVGTVVRAGSESSHLIDTRVIVGAEQACGECDICRRGQPVLCPHGDMLGRDRDGTLASFVCARARWVCPLEGDLGHESLRTPAAALLGREAAWAYAMFAHASIAPGEPVFIVGDNVVARFLVDIAIAKGVDPMVICPVDWPGFALWLEQRGAIPLPIPTMERGDDACLALRELAEKTANRHGHGRRPWFVFETTATQSGRHAAFALTVPGGRTIVLGRRALGARQEQAPHDGLYIDRLVDVQGTLIGVTGAHPDLLPEVAALVVRGELDIESAARAISIGKIAARSSTGADSLLDGEDRNQPPRGLVLTLDD